jgi:hypothetical protein
MAHNVFSTVDYLDQYPDLAHGMAEAVFPRPFTVGDYRRWFGAMRLTDEAEGDELTDRAIFLRQYRGALAVAKVTPLAVEEAEETAVSPTLPGDEDDEFTARYEAYENRPYKPLDTAVIGDDDGDLPITWASFLVEAAEAYIGPKIIVGPIQDVVKRRQAVKHPYPIFQHDFCLDLLPDMAEYKGWVLYRDPLTKSGYRRYTKAIAALDGLDPRDINNSLLLRQLRGAAALVSQFKFKGLNWHELIADDFERMPLELASFLVETCDVFLAKRMSAKK